MLATRDARDYYRPLGFSDLAHPDWLMEIVGLDIYKRGRARG
jgi:hypothetical protein